MAHHYLYLARHITILLMVCAAFYTLALTNLPLHLQVWREILQFGAVFFLLWCETKGSNPAPRRVVYRERFLTSQDHLRQLLKEKDERKKKLIQTISQQKVSQSTLTKKENKIFPHIYGNSEGIGCKVLYD
jgi:hypothetical protein